MKRALPPIFFLMVIAAACNNQDQEKKNNNNNEPAAASDTISMETLPPIEKEFNDSASSAPVQDSVLLKFNFQKGRVYNYIMSFDLHQNKGEQTRSTNMKWSYDLQVMDEKNKIKTVKATYKRIDMAVDMGGGQKMEFSSEKPAEEINLFQMPSKIFSIVKGKSFTMQVNAKGEIVSVSGFDQIGEAVVKEANLPAEMQPMIQKNFRNQFSDERVKELFSQVFSVFPNRYVKVGDSWQRETPAFGPQQLAMKTTYTVSKIKGHQVFVSGRAGSKATETTPSLSQTSKLIIDGRTGLVTDASFNQESGGTVTKGRVIGKER